MMKKRKALCMAVSLALAAAAALGGCAQSTTANTSSSASSKLKSDKLVIYTALQQDDMSWIQTQFKQDTGINLSFMLFSAGDLAAKVTAEMANPQADVMLGGSVEYYENLEKQNAFVKYTAPNSKGLDAEFIDPNGYWQGWYLGVLAIFYNTDRFDKELAPQGVKAPQTWDDLLDSHYKKQFITSNPATAGAAYIFLADQLFRLGETDGWTYLQNLNKNVDHYTKGADDPISLVATGQFIAGMSWAHDILKTQKQGYPIKVVVPKDTAFEIGGAAAIKGGANTDNAKTFINWLLTKSAQQKNTDVSNRYSVRKDIKPPEGLIKMEDVKLVKYDRPKASSIKTDETNKFTQMIGQ